MSYTKLFGSLLDSSIWQEDKHVKILWITLLAMKDRDGLVEASVPGLARRAGLTVQETVDGLKILLAPDSWSRTPDHEGRRIETAEGGWRVLNHDRYRDKDGAADARKKGKERVARFRERQKLENLDHRGKICTYVIVQEGTGFMKIGSSASLNGRLADLQIGSPTRLYYAYAVAEDVESELHEAFADIRASGEWFKHTPDNLRRIIAKIDDLVPSDVTRYSTLHLTSDPYADADLSDLAPLDPSAPSCQPPPAGLRADRDQPPPVDRGGARAAGSRVPPAPPIAEVHERARPPVPQSPLHPHVAAADDARGRQGLVQRFREAIAEARRKAAAKHSLTGVRFDIPLHGGENETELRQRLKDAGANAESELEHVLAVAIAEAMANSESVQWLGWNLGRSRSWDRALRIPLEHAGAGKKSVFDVVDDAVAEITPPTDGDS